MRSAGDLPHHVPFFAVDITAARRGFVAGSPPYTSINISSHPSVSKIHVIHFDASAISFDMADRCAVFLASAFPLSCLIFDHRLWPDRVAGEVENRRHRGHKLSELRKRLEDRRPLENAAILNVSFVSIERIT
jgi:hypothetical protein